MAGLLAGSLACLLDGWLADLFAGLLVGWLAWCLMDWSHRGPIIWNSSDGLEALRPNYRNSHSTILNRLSFQNIF